MNERAIRFGEGGRLVGILTEADGEHADEEKPTVILLNSGILHRVGAGRLYVKLARGLAGAGFSAFRFDFSGIGDSEARRDRATFEASSVAETRTAMDLLTTARSARRFVLGGLCSGAGVAFQTALEDTRVVGLIQMDGFAYPTARFHLNRWWAKLSQPSTWPTWLEARARSWLERMRLPGDGEDAALLPSGYHRTFPSRTETAEGLRELSSRGVAFYNFFSGSHRPYLNYPEQYADSFPDVDFGSRLHVDFLPESDHTVTNLAHQRFVIDAIMRWTHTHWPTRTPTAAEPPAATARDPLPTGAER